MGLALLPGTIVGYEYNKAIRILVALSEGNRFCQAAFNGEFGNSRDASVHADGAKSKFPKRVARALRRRNSLRVATQIGGGACLCFRFRDCGPHSAQTENGDWIPGRALLLINFFDIAAGLV